MKQRIETAARRVGRDPSAVKLVAVSKTKSAEHIYEAYCAGQRCFGENYAQELRDKYDQLKTKDERLTTHDQIEWHFVGHLQKNKAKFVAPLVSWIESIDSLELASAIDRRAARPINCLIEINIGGEESKTGVPPSQLTDLACGLSDFKNLKLKGLMIIPPISADPEESRPYFKKLKEILQKLNEQKVTPGPLRELSMGMSYDFEAAIEEGATIVRVGTAIFGERK